MLCYNIRDSVGSMQNLLENLRGLFYFLPGKCKTGLYEGHLALYL